MFSTTEKLFHVLLVAVVVPGALLQLYPDTDLRTPCPSRLSDKIYAGYTPKGNKTAGKFLHVGRDLSLEACVAKCCSDEQTCNVVFMVNNTCYEIECVSNALCEPVKRTEAKFQNVFMVLVRPVPIKQFQWDELPELSGDGNDIVAMSSEVDGVKSCDGLQDVCGNNEVCLAGVCTCQNGFERSADGACMPPSDLGISSSSGSKEIVMSSMPGDVLLSAPKSISKSSESDASSPSPPKRIIVNVISKTVRLPENEVKLSAFTVPAEIQGVTSHYTYKWKLLSQPGGEAGNQATSEPLGPSLKLTHLTEGVYTFKVTVTAPGKYGEAEANVTVLSQKRENESPIAIVLPPHQIVKLPNSLAVLDASSSRDDSGITKYHWELQQGPLGYQPNLSDTQTLQLRDLKKAGNYTFRLTLTDTDGATNSTLANVTVLQVPDYPPEANAGSSIVLFLPRNNVTLNGSLSSDDKGIVSWEWTKSPSDQDKAVDMQNTRTPYLELSHLEEGMYTFVLKVTDNSGQSSSSDVHVFVKPPTNKPPIAHAGPNVSIALPQTWVILNGSASSDDISIDQWKWEQLSGPRKAEFSHFNQSSTNVTSLTKGEYIFQLTITDGNGNSVSDKTAVIVTQNKNEKPKANAGGDQTYSMPLGVLVVNGSSSSDDLGIAKWQWTREPTSLAIGNIIGQSDTSPVLMVANVVAGKYEFRLRVSDDQGEWDEDTVSIILKADPELLNLVELTLNIEAGKFTQTQRDSVLLKLGMLLRDASQLVVRNLNSDSSGRAVLVFYVSSPSGSVPGPWVVSTLKNKLAQDSFLLQLSVVDIRTTVCQNNCSGHGVCNQDTRICYCEAFWMQDLVRKYMGDGESNCGWSILYVIIGLVSLAFLSIAGIWGLVCLCSRMCHSYPKDTSKTRYALLESTEQVKMPLSKTIQSDSETDSDVLFENRHGKSNGTKSFRNGFKTEPRVKT
ncbi:PKD [Nesidiocoris tenuis]|uniref:PKD n=1 Tax=Nesidiocoris tenuis TaxID=355587 RepID=A0ABN7A5Z5_9HEMI|nr:PKD [Nesidiocoris tenuis]